MLWSSVFGYTTILICQHLQYRVITEINMITTAIGVNMVVLGKTNGLLVLTAVLLGYC